MRTAGLTSSTADNVFHVHDEIKEGRIDAEFTGVYSDRDSEALELAEKRGLEAITLGDEDDFEAALLEHLWEAEVELVLADGFMPILSGEFLDSYEGTILNAHPSLLPAFRTSNPWKAALEAGVEVTGCTVHVVTEEIADGGIVTQEPVRVQTDDTEDDLRERIDTAERQAYVRAVEDIVEGKVEVDGGTVHREAGDGLSETRLESTAKEADLRYGENPHQDAAFYRDRAFTGASVGKARQHQGKAMSYNNYNDADSALSIVREFREPAAVVVKHTNPCGVAVADDVSTAYDRALATDEMSAFGGIVALNRECTAETAEAITDSFKEVVVAPDYTEEAHEVFEEKENLRVLETSAFEGERDGWHTKDVEGGTLVQQRDSLEVTRDDLEHVTERTPSEAEVEDMLFGFKVVKHVKSNAIVLVDGRETVGVGAGQMSRVDAVRLARDKAEKPVEGTVLASDAFFPFRDNIDEAAEAGVAAVVQPGGSVNDDEVVEACDEHGMAMAFTGSRCFKH